MRLAISFFSKVIFDLQNVVTGFSPRPSAKKKKNRIRFVDCIVPYHNLLDLDCMDIINCNFISIQSDTIFIFTMKH